LLATLTGAFHQQYLKQTKRTSNKTKPPTANFIKHMTSRYQEAIYKQR
jgi:hypothetical protein